MSDIVVDKTKLERVCKALDLMAHWLDFEGSVYNDPWVQAAGSVAQVAVEDARLLLEVGEAKAKRKGGR